MRPILADACFACHGPDKAKRKGDLRLDTEEGGKGVVVPGKPDESELVMRILGTDGHAVMPPPKSGRQLSAAQIAILRRWVAEGADWQPHWAFLPPRRPAVPKCASRWHGQPHRPLRPRPAGAGGLDPLARGVAAHAHPPAVARPDRPAADAGRGAMPSSKTRGPDAYERLVDRLLACPRLGERLA